MTGATRIMCKMLLVNVGGVTSGYVGNNAAKGMSQKETISGLLFVCLLFFTWVKPGLFNGKFYTTHILFHVLAVQLGGLGICRTVCGVNSTCVK